MQLRTFLTMFHISAAKCGKILTAVIIELSLFILSS